MEKVKMPIKISYSPGGYPPTAQDHKIFSLMHNISQFYIVFYLGAVIVFKQLRGLASSIKKLLLRNML